MFLDIMEFTVENKKNCLGKTGFENVFSYLTQKKPMCPQNYF